MMLFALMQKKTKNRVADGPRMGESQERVQRKSVRVEEEKESSDEV